MNLFERGDIIPGGAGRVLLGEYIQGEQYSIAVTLTDANDNPVDLSAYQISGKVKYYHGTISGSGENLEVNRDSVREMSPAVPDKQLDFTVLDQSQAANLGRFDLLIPTDIFTGDIDPTGETFPILALFWSISDGGNPARINKQRMTLIVRFGG